MFRLRGRAGRTTVQEGALRPPHPDGIAAGNAEDLVDERLVRDAQAGDLAAFNALVRRHERAVYGLCLRVLRDSSAAEDATQDTFVKAWTSIDTFRGGHVRPWLLRIATNRCYDILRARGRRPADSLDAQPYDTEPAWSLRDSPDEDPEGFATRTELAVRLERALGALPDDQRIAVVLSDVQGHGYDEIAAITGVAVGTVKSRISRGRARLRDLLRDDPVARELLSQFSRPINE